MLIEREQIGEVVTTIPTIGFNVESVTYKNLNFNVWVSKLATSLFALSNRDPGSRRANLYTTVLAMLLRQHSSRDLCYRLHGYRPVGHSVRRVGSNVERG